MTSISLKPCNGGTVFAKVKVSTLLTWSYEYASVGGLRRSNNSEGDQAKNRVARSGSGHQLPSPGGPRAASRQSQFQAPALPGAEAWPLAAEGISPWFAAAFPCLAYLPRIPT